MSVHTVPPDQLPKWKNFIARCLRSLGLYSSKYVRVSIHRVTVDPSGSITDPLEVDSFDGTPTHFPQLELAPLPTLED